LGSAILKKLINFTNLDASVPSFFAQRNSVAPKATRNLSKTLRPSRTFNDTPLEQPITSKLLSYLECPSRLLTNTTAIQLSYFRIMTSMPCLAHHIVDICQPVAASTLVNTTKPPAL
jgi:hypothetical protein